MEKDADNNNIITMITGRKEENTEEKMCKIFIKIIIKSNRDRGKIRE